MHAYLWATGANTRKTESELCLNHHPFFVVSVYRVDRFGIALLDISKEI